MESGSILQAFRIITEQMEKYKVESFERMLVEVGQLVSISSEGIEWK